MAYVKQRAGLIAAIEVGRTNAMDEAAARVQAAAIAEAAAHRLTGAYIRSFSIHNVPGLSGTGVLVRDRLVVNDDPGAAAIEWGYIRRFQNSRRAQYVPGQHIMGKAIRKVGD